MTRVNRMKLSLVNQGVLPYSVLSFPAAAFWHSGFCSSSSRRTAGSRSPPSPEQRVSGKVHAGSGSSSRVPRAGWQLRGAGAGRGLPLLPLCVPCLGSQNRALRAPLLPAEGRACVVLRRFSVQLAGCLVLSWNQEIRDQRNLRHLKGCLLALSPSRDSLRRLLMISSAPRGTQEPNPGARVEGHRWWPRAGASEGCSTALHSSALLPWPAVPRSCQASMDPGSQLCPLPTGQHSLDS